MSVTEILDAVKALSPAERRAVAVAIERLELALPFIPDDDNEAVQAQDLLDARSQEGLPTVSLSQLATELGLCVGK